MTHSGRIGTRRSPRLDGRAVVASVEGRPKAKNLNSNSAELVSAISSNNSLVGEARAALPISLAGSKQAAAPDRVSVNNPCGAMTSRETFSLACRKHSKVPYVRFRCDGSTGKPVRPKHKHFVCASLAE